MDEIFGLICEHVVDKKIFTGCLTNNLNNNWSS